MPVVRPPQVPARAARARRYLECPGARGSVHRVEPGRTRRALVPRGRAGALILAGCAASFAPLACSDSSTPPTGDVTAPAAIADLRVHSATSNSVTLRWTAPGDDGREGRAESYDIRYASLDLTEANWDSASVVTTPILPQSPGAPESIVVRDLAPSTWYFAVRSADEVPNWSALSNVVSAEVADREPPAAVTDLAITPTGLRSLRLSWTAPGDDGNEGTASAYELRFAADEITESTWEAAAIAPNVPAPAIAGTPQTATIADLAPGTSYFVGLKSRDLANWSGLSNVVSATTPSTYRLTQSPRGQQASSPSWSPDGASIAFSANDENPPASQIYVVPAEGGERERITDVIGEAVTPSWSPDGARIACVIAPPAGTPRELWVLDPSGETEPLLLTSHAPQRVNSLSWSPDGSRIAYAVFETGDIHVVPSEGGASTMLVPGEGLTLGLSWSPIGDQLVFASTRGGNLDLWTVPVTGGVPVAITNHPARDFGPVWSPDGNWIAFNSDRATEPGLSDIWVMSADGSGLRQITSGPWHETAGSWSPDGSRLAYSETIQHSPGATGDIWVVYLPDLETAR